MEGLIILIVTLVAFLALGIFVIVKIVKGPKLPEGHRVEAEIAGNKAIVIVDNDIAVIRDKDTSEVTAWLVDGTKIDAVELAKKCAAAIAATESAFSKKGVQKAGEDRVVFLYQTDQNYETGNASWWQAWSKGTAAYSTSVVGMFGTKRTPIAVIRSKHMKTTIDRAQPAIHELVHILNKASGGNYNHDHSDTKLWLGVGGDDSVEGVAVAQWANLVETFNDEDRPK